MKTSYHLRTISIRYLLAALTACALMQTHSGFAVCSADSHAAGNARYQVTSDRWDPVLQQHWISVADCDHLDRPRVSRLTDATFAKDKLRSASGNDRERSLAVLEQRPLVRAGEVVTVLQQEDSLRIEMGGVAEQNAHMGDPVRIRLSKIGVDSGQSPKEIVAVVSGPAIVEMR